ncbi:hypothetical protein B0G75_106224 [Paraburkholderia sp. BL18I3N2]|nr:hypothetical protein B0G75_106224 [Paraburkholderia sp. BL18I3N2]
MESDEPGRRHQGWSIVSRPCIAFPPKRREIDVALPQPQCEPSASRNNCGFVMSVAHNLLVARYPMRLRFATTSFACPSVRNFATDESAIQPGPVCLRIALHVKCQPTVKRIGSNAVWRQQRGRVFASAAAAAAAGRTGEFPRRADRAFPLRRNARQPACRPIARRRMFFRANCAADD